MNITFMAASCVAIEEPFTLRKMYIAYLEALGMPEESASQVLDEVESAKDLMEPSQWRKRCRRFSGGFLTGLSIVVHNHAIQWIDAHDPTAPYRKMIAREVAF